MLPDDGKIVSLFQRSGVGQRGYPAEDRAPDGPARVLMLPQRQAISLCFSASERIAALRWVEDVRSLGIARIEFDHGMLSGRDGGRDYVLIYERGRGWASWGIRCSRRGYALWHAPSFRDMGRYGTLGAALAGVEAQHGLDRGSRPGGAFKV